MAIRRFYCFDLDDSAVELAPDDAAHARKVLRLAAGHTVELFDGQGTIATGEIAELSRRCVVNITERRTAERLKPTVDIAAALPKGSRADVLVEKLSELGADRLIPLLTTRTVTEPRSGKLDRFGRIAVESAKQCGRPWLMEIDEPAPLAALLARADHDAKRIADVPDVQDLQPGVGGASMLKDAARVLVLIGPEGGWTDEERRQAAEAGFAPWRLGPHVLRVETAAIAAVACLRQST